MVAVAHDLQSDAVLVRAAQDGDGDAFAELFRRHYESVRRACMRRLRDSRDADDVAQAAFARAWERIDRCAGDRRFGGWIQVVAQNLCIDTLRQKGRVAPTQFPDADAPAPDAQQPETSVLRHEQSHLVQLALADLPPRQRDVVVARDLHERRPGEIAAALGLSVGAVDSLLLRGRRRLAKSIERLGGDTGAINAATSSSVASGAVGASGRLGVLAQSLSDAISRASYQVAASLGMVPGAQGPVQKFAAAAMLSGAAVTGALLPAAAPGPATALPTAAVPHPPAIVVPAAPTPAPPAAAPATPAAPSVSPPPVAVGVPAPGAPAVKAPGAVTPVLTTVGALGQVVSQALRALGSH